MVKGKAWFRIKDPPAGEGQVGQSQTHLKDHLIDFFHLPFYFFTFSTPSSLITPLSFGEVVGGEALSLLEKADKTVATRSTEYR